MVGCISPLARPNLCIMVLLAWLAGNVRGDHIHGAWLHLAMCYASNHLPSPPHLLCPPHRRLHAESVAAGLPRPYLPPHHLTFPKEEEDDDGGDGNYSGRVVCIMDGAILPPPLSSKPAQSRFISNSHTHFEADEATSSGGSTSDADAASAVDRRAAALCCFHDAATEGDSVPSISRTAWSSRSSGNPSPPEVRCSNERRGGEGKKASETDTAVPDWEIAAAAHL